MATKTITIHECDLCKREVERKSELRKIRLPNVETMLDYGGTNYFMDDYNSSDKSNVIDCCDDCSYKMAKLLSENFGFYYLNEDEIRIREGESI